MRTHLDIETHILQAGVNLLKRLAPARRRHVLDYWSGIADGLPLTDAKGAVIDEHPPQPDPPILNFIRDHAAGNGPATAQ